MRKSIIKVVIPGNVDQKRRNYKEILKKLKGFTSTTQIKIYFLGKAKTIELQWLKDFERNKPKNISINYFTEKVSDEKFNEVMQQSNILWCPIQHETEFFSQTETYGKTKMSGNIGDSIKYGKTAIFPKNYFSRYAFLIPEEKDVEKQILNCHQNLKCDFQKKFNKEKIQKDLETVLKSML